MSNRPPGASLPRGAYKDPSPFWTLPGPQVRAILTGLQAKTPVNLSGETISEKTISESGQRVKLYIVKPEKASGRLPVLLFIHGGVWIAGDFENHKRLVRDLVIGSGAGAVFVEYTPIPDAVFPTQMSSPTPPPSGSPSTAPRLGSTAAGWSLPATRWEGTCRPRSPDRQGPGGPKLRLQVLFIPATDTNFQTQSYKDFESGRFLARAFMQWGWDIYAPDARTRANPYAVPMRRPSSSSAGSPRRW